MLSFPNLTAPHYALPNQTVHKVTEPSYTLQYHPPALTAFQLFLAAWNNTPRGATEPDLTSPNLVTVPEPHQTKQSPARPCLRKPHVTKPDLAWPGVTLRNWASPQGSFPHKTSE